MIPREFIKSLNLPPDKEAELQKAIEKERLYYSILHKAGIMPGAAAAIMRTADTSGIDEAKEEIYLEKAKVEYSDFIQKARAGK